MDWLPTADTALTDAAVAYASHGFRVHLVWGMRADGRCQCGKSTCVYPENKSAGKHPIAARWQKTTTSDVDAVRDARSKRPNANVGIALGGDARLVAVDIDGEKGRASWATYIEANGRVAPVTLTQRTGRPDGGEQRIYSLAKRHDPKRLGNRASFRYPGIDTRVDNGQVVVPPSVHGSGKRYEWIVRAPIAEIPDWLFELLAEEVKAPTTPRPAAATPTVPTAGLDPYLARVLERAAHDVATCTEGGRNQLLFAKSCTVFEYFIGENLDHLVAWRAMNDAGLACGLPAGEVSGVMSKAWRQAQKAPPRKIPPRTTTDSRRNVSPSTEFSPTPSEDAEPAAVQTPVPTAESEGYPADWEDASKAPEASDRSWEEHFQKTAEGAVKSCFGNVLKILRNAPKFKGRWSYNEMRITPCLDEQPLKDADVAKLRELLEDDWNLTVAKETATDAIMGIATERSFHPVKRYLGGLKWDGEARIARIIPELFGGKDDALAQRMMRAWFVSAVARGLRPGCKVDTALVLFGEQGHRKSTFFEVLGGEWYSNSYVDVRDKDGVLQVHAGWIYEWAEIERITTKRDADVAKAFITIARDNVRPPYGRGVVNQPRSGVIVGTTNKRFLDDETGSRRFWPITIEHRLGDEELATLAKWRDQLWAEAVAALEAGETWWLDEEQERQRAIVAREHAVEDVWTERIAAWLNNPSRKGAEVTILDVLVSVIGVTVDRIDRAQETRVGKALRALGWVPRQTRRDGAPIRLYRAPESQPLEVVTEVVTGVVTAHSIVDSDTSKKSHNQSQPTLEFSGGRHVASVPVSFPKEVVAGCDFVDQQQSSTEDHSPMIGHNLSHNHSHNLASDEEVVACPNGYPASWDEEGT